MKKVTSLLAILLLLFNCQESKDLSSVNQTSPFNRNTGKQISMKQAQRWINRYKQNTNSSRTETAPQLTKAALDDLLNPITEKLGISFHRAIDQDGGYHILVVPIKEGQPMWNAEKILDANNNVLLSSQIAEHWAARYKTENPDGVRSHFFGIHIFEKEFHTIDLVEAVNDQNVPQLLLFVWRKEINGGGRIATAEPDVFDHGQICPPHCGVSGDSNN